MNTNIPFCIFISLYFFFYREIQFGFRDHKTRWNECMETLSRMDRIGWLQLQLLSDRVKKLSYIRPSRDSSSTITSIYFILMRQQDSVSRLIGSYVASCINQSSLTEDTGLGLNPNDSAGVENFHSLVKSSVNNAILNAKTYTKLWAFDV